MFKRYFFSCAGPLHVKTALTIFTSLGYREPCKSTIRVNHRAELRAFLRGIIDFVFFGRGDEALHLVEDLLGVVGAVGHDGDPDRRELPGVLATHLGARDAEAPLAPLDDGLEDGPPGRQRQPGREPVGAGWSRTA